MRIVISTTYDSAFDEVAKIVVPNHLAYCRVNGYEYNLHHAPYRGGSTFRNGNLLYVENMLPHFDIVVSVDLDLLFMRHDIKIEEIFPSEWEQQIALSANLPGGDSVINNGVILWRNRQSSIEILRDIRENQSALELNQMSWQWYFTERITTKHWIVKNMNIVNQHTMNTYFREYNPGDFIYHAYFATLEEKIQVLQSNLAEVK